MASNEVKVAAGRLIKQPEFHLVMDAVLDQYDEALMSTDPQNLQMLQGAALRREAAMTIVQTVAEFAASTVEN